MRHMDFCRHPRAASSLFNIASRTKCALRRRRPNAYNKPIILSLLAAPPAGRARMTKASASPSSVFMRVLLSFAIKRRHLLIFQRPTDQPRESNAAIYIMRFAADATFLLYTFVECNEHREMMRQLVFGALPAAFLLLLGRAAALNLASTKDAFALLALTPTIHVRLMSYFAVM
jgi:hypothetical protein